METILEMKMRTAIKIIGCGSAGIHIVDHLIDSGLDDVDFMAIDTDMQSIKNSKSPNRILIGKRFTGGQGADGNPNVGRKSAEKISGTLEEFFADADMVILIAGLGGGTGTGAAPVIAKIAKQVAHLTLAIATTPSNLESEQKIKQAEDGLQELRKHVDSLVEISNQNIAATLEKDDANFFNRVFGIANDIIYRDIVAILDIINKDGEINCDFIDIMEIMKNQQDAIIGVGISESENRCTDAAQKAVSNFSLKNYDISEASNILINIICPSELAMTDVDDIIKVIVQSSSPKLKVMWGMTVDATMGEKISVTVIATGFNKNK